MQLEIFGTVMSTGTTVGAAHLLRISQSAVGNAVHNREAQLELPPHLSQPGTPAADRGGEAPVRAQPEHSHKTALGVFT